MNRRPSRILLLVSLAMLLAGSGLWVRWRWHCDLCRFHVNGGRIGCELASYQGSVRFFWSWPATPPRPPRPLEGFGSLRAGWGPCMGWAAPGNDVTRPDGGLTPQAMREWRESCAWTCSVAPGLESQRGRWGFLLTDSKTFPCGYSPNPGPDPRLWIDWVGEGRPFRAVEAPLWAIMLPATLWPFRGLCYLLHRWWWRRRGLCVECGYDLRATPERCPECGTVPAGAGDCLGPAK